MLLSPDEPNSDEFNLFSKISALHHDGLKWSWSF